MKTKVVTNKEMDELKKEHPENIIEMIQQEDGSFQLKSPHTMLPTVIVNEVLTQLHKVYENNIFNKKYAELPEKHKEYAEHLLRKLATQRRWTIFWYAVAITALGYIFIVGGR